VITRQPAPRARRLAALLAALALGISTLAGCSGQAEEELAAKDSPLEKYLTAMQLLGHGSFAAFPQDGTPAEQKAYNEQVHREAEELVARCMAEAGFDYTPDVRTTQEVGGSDTVDYEPDNRDWVAAYGYGMIAGPSEPVEVRPVGPDPNEPYLSSLSQAERDAYDQAMWGMPQLNEDGEYESTWQTAGCRGWAQHELDGVSPQESGEFAQLADAINRFEETSSSDPGYAALDAEWSSCMAEAGYGGFQKQQEARESIFAVMDTYYQNYPTDDSDPDFGTPRDSEYVKLARTVEIPLALADLDCREQTDYRTRHTRIQFDLEERFIADHREELEALVAQAGQSR